MIKRKAKKYNMRKIVLAIADMFIIGVSSLLSNYILSVGHLKTLAPKALAVETLMLIVVVFLTLWVSGAYRKMWRYFKLSDYVSCILGTTIGTFIVALFSIMGMNSVVFDTHSFWYYVLQMVISTIGIVLFRLIFKKTFLILVKGSESPQPYQYKKRTLIIGGGTAGKIILTDIKSVDTSKKSPGKQYNPVGIIDDNPKKLGTMIKGVQVLGNTKDIGRICSEEDIEVIIFAIPSANEESRLRILDICSKTKCEIKVIPYISQLLQGDNTPAMINQIKDIRIEDLLGRPAISFDTTEIRNLIHGKVCMVTGGGGSIGSELVRQIARYGAKQIIVVDIYENNAYDIQQEIFIEHGHDFPLVALIATVRDYDKMESIMKKYKPHIVMHAAAHKHVPLMEEAPEEAVKNNVVGTYNMAMLSGKYNVQKFIMISTDKAVNPTNVMGATKRCCEMIVQYMSQSEMKTEFVTTRFGNVLGSNGSVIPLFRRQIENGNPVTVTHPDIIRYFMTIPEAVSLVLEAGAMAKGGEIFVLDMGAPVKITTLAENLIRLYGKEPYKDVDIKFTGLRPGEKLFEELLMDEEGLVSTKNKKIFIGNQIEIDRQNFYQHYLELEACAMQNDADKTIEMLSEMVPTFNHQTNNG